MEEKTTLKLGGGNKLELKVKSGAIAQNLAHGRSSRGVTVEVKKKRTIVKKSDEDKQTKGSLGQDNSSQAFSTDNSTLTDNERENRLQVLKKAAEDEKKNKIEAEIRAKKEEERRLQEEERLRQEEKALQEAEEERLRIERESGINLFSPEPVIETVKQVETKKVQVKEQEEESDEEESRHVKPIKGNERISANLPKKIKIDVEETSEEKSVKPRKGEAKRRSNKITVAQALSDSGEERVRSLASVRRAREKAKRLLNEPRKEKEKLIREVILPEVITVQELANRMAERVYDVTKVLMRLGMMVNSNQSIDADTAELIAAEFGHSVKRVTDADVENVIIERNDEDTSSFEDRAPVVTFMGHVDHGKTSLLDAIRKSHVARGESGGITQHIGAYQVQTDSGEKITFLDTPGHEAFTAMRQRGANATDIVVLVVAADDGIMAQTVEAISHAKAAKVPIIVAINKIDKPGADAQAIRTALLSHELVTEDMGGDVLAVEVSAKQGINLDKLLEVILLQSEVLQLKANPDRKASGVVIESKIDKGRGVVATLLVQKGTLVVGDLVVAGEAYGKVRAMQDATGKNLIKAGPSVPVEILGLDETPEAGVAFAVTVTDKQAREIVEYRKRKTRDLRSAVVRKTSLEDLFEQAGSGGIKELPVIVKGDVQGSVEAIVSSLNKLATNEVKIRVLHSGVGAINGSDVTLANASHAVILGFHVRADSLAKELSTRDNVDVRYYSVIYDLINDMKAILSGMLKPIIREQYLGTAEIREIFGSGKKTGKVAGCFVNDGVIQRGAMVRILRDNIVVFEGKLKTLRRFKDDVKEVGSNFECGMAFENFDDIKEKDSIEAFNLIEEQRSI